MVPPRSDLLVDLLFVERALRDAAGSDRPGVGFASAWAAELGVEAEALADALARANDSYGRLARVAGAGGVVAAWWDRVEALGTFLEPDLRRRALRELEERHPSCGELLDALRLSWTPLVVA